MKAVAITIALSVVGVSARAETLPDLSWRAFETICLKASEESVPARDIAEQVGFLREAAPPEALLGLLPLGSSTASFSASADDGKVHAISTVVPPPATPFSCMVAVEQADDATWTRMLSGMAASSRYATNAGTQNETGSGLDFQYNQDGAINRVIGIRTPSQSPGAPNMMFIAFRTEQ